jgi:hypothetical protein
MYMNHNSRGLFIAGFKDSTARYDAPSLEVFVKDVINCDPSYLRIAEDGQEGDLASLIDALEDGALLSNWFGNFLSAKQQEGVEDVWFLLKNQQQLLAQER